MLTIRSHPPSGLLRWSAALVLLSLVASTAIARDRKPPSAPTNLRLTGVSAYSVSLAWNPSSDDSGQITYIVCCGSSAATLVTHPTTSVVVTEGVQPNTTYTFRVTARDSSWNLSKSSNAITVTTRPDSGPPTVPVVNVDDVGPTHVTLSWRSTDEGPIWYTVVVDGVAQPQTQATSKMFFFEPETTHTFSVQARDFVNQRSAFSDPVTVTTEPTNESDVTGPTMPGNLAEAHFGDREINLTWSPSMDDNDSHAVLRYEVYVNGNLEDWGIGITKSIVYGIMGPNTIEVIAIDTAGNASPPATITVDTLK